MQEATIITWLKMVGDRVVAGEPLLEVETDKVEVAVEAPASGILAKQCVPAGEIVAVGGVLAIIEED